MFTWQAGEEAEEPYVLINGTKYYVQFTETGETPLTASNLNRAQEELLGDMEAEASEEFDVNKNYKKGGFCIKDNTIYKANEDIPAGLWDSTKWTATTITNELENRLEFDTVETKVGTWVNGKPLYKKTYTTYTEDTSGSDVIFFLENGTNFAKSIDVKNREYSAKIQYLSSQNYLKAYNGDNGALGTFYFGHNITGGNLYVSRSNFNSNYNVIALEVTIYYTKATD